MLKYLKPLFVLPIAILSFTGYAQVDNPSKLGLVTGSTTGTYIKFGQDMAKVTNGTGLELLVKESEGSLANIRRMISKENAGVGIVQSDVLGFLTRSSDPEIKRIAKRLRLIFPFYDEEVHLYARTSVNSIADLEGKRVVVGTKGSGNWLTTTNLLHIMGIEPSQRLNLGPAEGATAVLTDKADAMFYVAGKPVELFSTIEQVKDNPKYQALAKHVHMVPLNDPKMLQEYKAAVLTPADYSWLEREIPTIAVKAVLVGFDFSRKKTPYYLRRCKELGTLGTAIRSNIDVLRSTGHPKWNEVNLEEDIGLWQRDKCSSSIDEVNAQPKQNNQDDFLIKGLENCIQTGTCQ